MVEKLMNLLFATDLAQRTCRAMGRAADVELPAPILSRLIIAYAMATGASMNDLEEPEGGFKSFGEFFGRRLRPGSRAVCAQANALTSPCDGQLVATGRIDLDAQPGFVVKGSRYSLGALLGTGGDEHAYQGGGFLVVYLHPRDYHRVHAPAAATLLRIRHVPGARYPVNHLFDGRVEAIYGKNERLVFHFELGSGEQFALVMVAAFGVGNLTTPHADRLAGSAEACGETRFDAPIPVACGDEIGAFLVGSTVVMVWPPNAFSLNEAAVPGPITMGRRLGEVTAGARHWGEAR